MLNLFFRNTPNHSNETTKEIGSPEGDVNTWIKRMLITIGAKQTRAKLTNLLDKSIKPDINSKVLTNGITYPEALRPFINCFISRVSG